jgi:hypothetical protein
MGTPPASAFVDQMSKEQKSASGAGECAGAGAVGDLAGAGGSAKSGANASCRSGAIITIGGCSALAVALG